MYITWAERQYGKRIGEVVVHQWKNDETENGLVNEGLTYKGCEFCYSTTDGFYHEKGIVHTKFGPKLVQLKLWRQLCTLKVESATKVQDALPKSLCRVHYLI
ncbi:hypothetical protein PHMEG_0001655 [Phytophthora megakarya]|uniref:Uncharacterized protein n=1 Tax=Phytophthora megakarya TaxID=4795 RepID=A0A225X2I2_9STRA|nr:hypothetical protein PHMEG_0001655 [Phytophthora megakarya]